MMSDQKIKAIIFDFDGVITESMGIKENAFLFVYRDYPEHRDEISALHRTHGGMSRFEKFEIIYRDILRKPYNKRVESALNKNFSEYVYEQVIKCPYVAGAKEFLAKYYKNFLFFIVSGTPEEEMRRIVKEKKINTYFKEVFGSPPKKGELCKKILADYKLYPNEVIMVGDSIDDYEGAKEAGVQFIGRITNRETFAECKTKATIRDLTTLEQFLS